MNGTSWYMSIGALAVGSVLAIGAARKMSAPLPKYKPSVVQASTELKSGSIVSAKVAAKAAAVDWDIIWKQSLFQSDRSEDNGDVASVGNISLSGSTQNGDFELVGIICMGEGDKGTPVAIIAQIRGLKLKSFSTTTTNNNRNQNNNRSQNNNRNNNNQRGNRRRDSMDTMPGPMFASQTQTETAPADRRVTRNIYHVGDEIGKTGYRVLAIVPAENKVVLERGGTKVVLALDVKNTNNSIRRQNVVNEELALRKKRVDEEKKRLDTLQKEAQQAAKQRQIAQQQAQRQQMQQDFRNQFQRQQRTQEQQVRVAQQAQQDLSNILRNMTQPPSQPQSRQVNMQKGNRLNDGSMNTGGR